MTAEHAELLLEKVEGILNYLDNIDVFIYMLIVVVIVLFMLRRVKIC